jgi:hypothetical protein
MSCPYVKIPLGVTFAGPYGFASERSIIFVHWITPHSPNPNLYIETKHWHHGDRRLGLEYRPPYLSGNGIRFIDIQVDGDYAPVSQSYKGSDCRIFAHILKLEPLIHCPAELNSSYLTVICAWHIAALIPNRRLLEFEKHSTKHPRIRYQISIVNIFARL